jgi:hypothetical protein
VQRVLPGLGSCAFRPIAYRVAATHAGADEDEDEGEDGGFLVDAEVGGAATILRICSLPSVDQTQNSSEST